MENQNSNSAFLILTAIAGAAFIALVAVASGKTYGDPKAVDRDLADLLKTGKKLLK